MAEDTKNRILETALSRRSWMSTSTASSPEWKKNIKSREHGKSFYGRRGHYGRYHLHHQHREHRALCTAAFARDRTACVPCCKCGGSMSPRVRRSSIWAGSWPVPSRAMPRRRGDEDRDDGACEVIYEIRRINKTSPLSVVNSGDTLFYISSISLTPARRRSF